MRTQNPEQNYSNFLSFKGFPKKCSFETENFLKLPLAGAFVRTGLDE
jgi:hypothetical protein